MTMFSQPKPLASLSSGLLARKGTARPAMRPQGYGGFGVSTSPQDDLGWNDMGHTHDVAPEPVLAPVVPTAPAISAPVPPVLRQREALQEEFAAPVAPPAPVVAEPLPSIPTPVALAEEVQPVQETKPVSVAKARRIERETQAKNARAAFTLRLDHDRHLRLRLASALHHASAQVLVTEALDQFLQSLPEVEELVRQLPLKAGRRSE